jgi:hypothetical protein
MTDALSLDAIEYEVTNMYRRNTAASTVVTYKNFDVPENREVRWNDNGRYGPGMYYVVPLPETFADVVTNNARMLGPHLPTTQETVVPTESVEQFPEKTYHHKGYHHNEPALRRRKYLRYRSQSEKNPLHTGKPNHRSRSPDELGREYYQEYEFGFSDNDHYYRPEMIDYHDYYYYYYNNYTTHDEYIHDFYTNDDNTHDDYTHDDYNNDDICECNECNEFYRDDGEIKFENCRNCGELFYTIDGDECMYCGH